MIIRGTTTAILANSLVAVSAQLLPTKSPTNPPTFTPSNNPTSNPTSIPTNIPTNIPTLSPSESPTTSPTVLIGCPPLWSSGVTGSYDPGSLVSHPDDTTGPDILVVYQCKDAPYHLYCPQPGFEPGSLYSDSAWIRRGKCNSAIPAIEPTVNPTGFPTTSPTLALWEEVGCPPEFEGGSLNTVYEEGSVVEYEGNVYECKPYPNSMRCNQVGYEPYSTYVIEAWNLLGSCTGSIAPTVTVTTKPWEQLGCPKEFVALTNYDDGELVENDGNVYECKPWPYSGLCGQPGYEPFSDLMTEAWTLLGGCSGTIAPTMAVTTDLWEKVGCPVEFDTSLSTVYEEGEVVAYEDVVYECKPWPDSTRCNQAGYEPFSDLMSEAWTLLGSCTGTIAPTMAVTFEAWAMVGCPLEFDSSLSTVYEEGEVVAYEDVVYECKPWPDAARCNQAGYEPFSDLMSEAWTLLGSCMGTIAPTMATTYEAWEKVGCPLQFDTSLSTAYEEGDVVAYEDVVYECKPWPNSARCNQAGYEPFSDLMSEAWTLLGSCMGTIAPTMATTYEAWEMVGCPPEFDSSLSTRYEEGEVVAFEDVVYECKPWPNSARCNQAGYEPFSDLMSEAWTLLGSCSGTIAPTMATTYEAWAMVGCPPEFDTSLSTRYEEGEVVAYEDVVYECKPWPNSARCNQAGYEPFSDLMSEAWTLLGSCSGTIAPTMATTYEAWEMVGCPPEFDTSLSTRYEDGETVAFEDVVYECKPWPNSARCNQAGYEPFSDLMSEAWTLLGSCSGTIAPTMATTYEAWEMVGCPPEFDTSLSTRYEEGETVAFEDVVYECKPWPDSARCNQAGYEPFSDLMPDAWTLLGSCMGTIAPSVAVTYEAWDKIGCPPAYDESLGTRYEIGDTVERDAVVYQCKAWPESARSNQAGYEPGTGQLWEQVWTVIGSCDGTIIPTSSPSRDLLPLWEKTGCPDEYSTTITYEEGDTVSAYGLRVFECKPWPDTGFCSMFSPEEEDGSLGWEVVGGCEGTIVPTNAPTAPDYSSCSSPEYDISETYEAGQLVSAEGFIYECKPLPYTLWCNNPGYAPGTENDSSAWIKIGPC